MALYGDGEGSRAMAILGISAISLSLLLATNGILQGLGKEKLPAKHLAIGVGVKALATLVFTSLMGIDGLALSWLISTAVVCLLNLRVIRSLVKVEVNWRFDVFLPFVVANVMLVLAWGTTEAVWYLLQTSELTPRLLGAVETIAGVGVGALFYLGLLLFIPLITREELEWIPGGGKVSQWLGGNSRLTVSSRR